MTKSGWKIKTARGFDRIRWLTVFVVLLGMAVANVPAILDMASPRHSGFGVVSGDDGSNDSDPAAEIRDCGLHAACSMSAILASTAHAKAPKSPVHQRASRQWLVTLDPRSPPSPPPKASSRS